MRSSINYLKSFIVPRIFLLILGVLGAALSTSAHAYDLRIANRSALTVRGQVNYVACRADAFTVAPGQTWSTNGRGLCLIRSIVGAYTPTAANSQVPPLAAYGSSGTSYADFTITQDRIWSAAELAARPPAPVATGPTVTWEAVAAGQKVPAAAFKGGRQQFGGRNDAAGNAVFDLLPVCRAQVNGAYAMGNAAPFYRHAGGWSWEEMRCYVFLNGKEQELDTYEVLIVNAQVAIRAPNAVRWVVGQNGTTPAGAFNAAHDAAKSGTTMVACRAPVDSALRVGTMGQNGCYMAYGGQNQFAGNYEVLVVDSGASQQMARGPNEPRLAAAPDRPARVARAGEDCTRTSGRCQARVDELRAMGAYKINSVMQVSATGNTVTRFKKAQGSVWEMREDTGTYTGGTLSAMRPYVEVERNDDQIILFSGPWDFGGPNGKVAAQTIVFALRSGSVALGTGGATLQVSEGTTTFAAQPVRHPSYGWQVNSAAANIERGMMAEPDTALSLTFKPVNGAQATTFWKGGTTPPVLLKGANGQFGDYKVASTGDGWLELYTVAGSAGKWRIQFLAVDFWRNRVWELLGETTQQPNTADVGALRTLARDAGPAKAWAEAYELTNASVFAGTNIGAAVGRVNGTQVAWTLREQAGGTIRWEELKSNGGRAAAGVAEGAPVGRLLTETARTDRSLTLSGSEFGASITIDWVAGTVGRGSAKIGDFLTGATEYVGQRKKLPPPTPPGISPGFQFINKTDWPVLVKVSQVGCLYHGVVQPHSTMTRNTGAVWFTLSASWATDGKDLSDEQVFTDCVAPVGFTVLGVIAAAATGGTASGVIALGASSAATVGAATTAVQFMNAAGASQGEQDAVAAAIYVVAAAASGGVGAFQVVRTSLAPGMSTAAARSALSATVAKGAAKEALIAMRDEAINYALFSIPNAISEPSDQEMTTLQSWFDSEISLAGQYAGYPWPWKMKDRVMPQYEITGGPRVDTLKDGSKLIRKGSPFKFVRVN